MEWRGSPNGPQSSPLTHPMSLLCFMTISRAAGKLPPHPGHHLPNPTPRIPVLLAGWCQTEELTGPGP